MIVRRLVPPFVLVPIAVLALSGALAEPGSRRGHGRNELAQETESRPTRRSFSGIRSWSQYVTMRDGVRLALDVHLPQRLADGERTATILHMSRYYRSVDIRGLWKPFLGFGIFPLSERGIREDVVKAGYSWVDVDVRGAGASFGHREYPLSAEEVTDGRDLLDWIIRQPWSAGIVGATGSSYDGTLASLLLRNGHPALKVVAPRFSGWDTYEDIFAPGGLPATLLLRDWARLTSALDRGRLTDVFGWTAGVIAGGVRPVDPRLLPQAILEHERNKGDVRLLDRLVYRDDPDPQGSGATMDDFSPHSLGDRAAEVPVYAYAGWFDGALARGQVRQYLSNRNSGSRLRLGPWFHGGDFNASPYANGRGNTFDHARELIRFFDYHLRGIDAGFSSQAPVHYYTMGEERWKTASTWPPPGAEWQSLPLAPGGLLGTPGGGPVAGRAPYEPPADPAYDRYQVDPMATTGPGSRWGLIVGTGAARGYRDQRDRDRRLVTYTSDPLEADIEITGHPVLRLYLAANAADGAVFAYVKDVAPGGDVHYVTEGQLRLIHRKLGDSRISGDPVPFRSYQRADARALVPGEVSEIVFDLLPTSFVFRAGHAIRLAIAGADAGVFDAPLPVSPLIYDVHRDRDHPSRLELPTYRVPASPVK